MKAISEVKQKPILEPKWCCNECNCVYDNKDDALECYYDCHRGDENIDKVFVCPLCNEKHDSEEEAIACHSYNPDGIYRPSPEVLEAAGQLRLIP